MIRNEQAIPQPRAQTTLRHSRAGTLTGAGTIDGANDDEGRSAFSMVHSPGMQTVSRPCTANHCFEHSRNVRRAAAHPLYVVAVEAVEPPAVVLTRTMEATAGGAGVVVSPVAKLAVPVTYVSVISESLM